MVFPDYRNFGAFPLIKPHSGLALDEFMLAHFEEALRVDTWIALERR